ncbi:class I SAM-dependent methyltransferase [Hydrogenophaga sp. OTU3427]|uniref:class I SAM-dependent methyltransferase n=1 Tax=Hydrogenophaga sp. OTU3427 TaxID=3043856 RepID=UPI00313BE00E
MFWKKRPTLAVPEKFNRNSSKVASLMTPEQSGQFLLQLMQLRLGLRDYTEQAVLDFGCGVRFSQAILNLKLPFGQYVGVDCFSDMIEFLRAHVKDPRFSYHLLDVRHPLYNPDGGTLLDAQTVLPLPQKHFDIAAMFSVLTHQHPDDAKHILALLRRYVKPTGRLFLTCFLDEGIASFEDRSPRRNGGMCFYHPAFLTQLLADSGWRPSARYAADAPLIGDSFVCQAG